MRRAGGTFFLHIANVSCHILRGKLILVPLFVLVKWVSVMVNLYLKKSFQVRLFKLFFLTENHCSFPLAFHAALTAPDTENFCFWFSQCASWLTDCARRVYLTKVIFYLLCMFTKVFGPVLKWSSKHVPHFFSFTMKVQTHWGENVLFLHCLKSKRVSIYNNERTISYDLLRLNIKNLI